MKHFDDQAFDIQVRKADRWILLKYLIGGGIILCCGAIFFLCVQIKYYVTQRVLCLSSIFQLGDAVLEYHDHSKRTSGKSSFPEYLDEDGYEQWSWRLVLLRPADPKRLGLDLSQSWNETTNLENADKDDNLFVLFNRSDYLGKENRKSPYVAVRGPGTVWSETNWGILANSGSIDNSRKILLIETTEPKNLWTQPGDDLSPDEVIRLFEADPGLVKNSHLTYYFFRRNWPRYFIRADGSSGRFDEFPDVDALRNALLIENTASQVSQ